MYVPDRGGVRGSNSLKQNLPSVVKYKLPSGSLVHFKEETVSNADLETITDVDLAINPRLLSSLTNEKLKHLSSSIKRNQFYAAIGYRKHGIIYIVDGSRRRQAAINAGVGLRVLVTDEELTTLELKEFVKEFQTNESLTVLEWGLQFSAELAETKTLKQKDLCDIYSKSTSFVSRAIQASSIAPELLGLFDDLEPLTTVEYEQLSSIYKEIIKNNLPLEGIDIRVKSEGCKSKKQIFTFLLSIFPSSSNNKVVKKKAAVVDVVVMSKKRYIKKQETLKGKGIDFKCAGLTDVELEKLEDFIKQLVN